MKNFAEGVDYLIQKGLDGLPTPFKLWVFLCDNAEADLTAGDGISLLTQTALTQAKGVTALTCVNRVVDLGVIQWTERVGRPKSMAVSTDDPAVVGAKLIALQNINAGAQLDLATLGPYACDGLSFKVAYEGEA